MEFISESEPFEISSDETELVEAEPRPNSNETIDIISDDETIPLHFLIGLNPIKKPSHTITEECVFTKGFKNMGNTCYMNAILYTLCQCHFKPFFDFITGNTFADELGCFNNLKIIFEFFQSYMRCFQRSYEKDYVSLPLISTQYVLQAFGINKLGNNEDFDDIFTKIRNDYLCTGTEIECRIVNDILNNLLIFKTDTSHIYDHLNDITIVHVSHDINFSLQIPIEEGSCLNDAIKQYFATSSIPMYNSISPHLRGMKIDIKNGPPILLIHLLRFNNSKKKLLTYFPFPFEFNLTQLAKTEREMSGFDGYFLKGIIVHKGDSLNNGHYFSIFHHHGQWIKFDDHKISIIPQIEETFGGNYETAYFLIYVNHDSLDVYNEDLCNDLLGI